MPTRLSKIPDFEPALEVLRRARRVVLTTHVHPDGDGLGSQMALGLCLQALGKEVRLINTSETPDNYHFLEVPSLGFEQFDESRHAEVVAAADAIVIVDMNDRGRLRSLGDHVVRAKAVKIIVDHHQDPEQFVERYIVDTDACASGEIVFDMVMELGGDPVLTHDVAVAIYAAIMTDTGSFRFPRTDPGVHRIAARLLEAGADPTTVYESVYNQVSLARQRLLGEALAHMELVHDGRLSLITVTRDMFARTGAKDEDVEEFVQSAMMIAGVRMGVLAVELRNGVKLSFRSKGDVSVNDIARGFGGGGHFHAAGARVVGRTLAAVLDEVTKATRAKV